MHARQKKNVLQGVKKLEKREKQFQEKISGEVREYIQLAEENKPLAAEIEKLKKVK